MKPHVASGALAVVGVVQDQHPDRVALYKQWRALDWPIFVDALNVLDHRVVPIPIGVNASGLVVMEKMKPEDLQVFLNKDFATIDLPKAPPPHAHEGDEFFYAGKLDEAVAAYEAGAAKDPRLRFRLGVALRRRFESDARREGDGQRAVEAWTDALAARPDQYIWRRRIQQYGPRLVKPYNMFGWIEDARKAIRARGEKPVALAVEPRGAEVIGNEEVAGVALADPDPDGKVPRDRDGLVRVDAIVTPARVRPGDAVRVRLVLRVGDAFWNNEAEPIALHVEAADGLVPAGGALGYPVPREPETREPRTLEVEIGTAPDASAGTHTLTGYALYNVCEKEGGVCRFLRQDLTVTIRIDPEAPKIQ